MSVARLKEAPVGSLKRCEASGGRRWAADGSPGMRWRQLAAAALGRVEEVGSGQFSWAVLDAGGAGSPGQWVAVQVVCQRRGWLLPAKAASAQAAWERSGWPRGGEEEELPSCPLLFPLWVQEDLEQCVHRGVREIPTWPWRPPFSSSNGFYFLLSGDPTV